MVRGTADAVQAISFIVEQGEGSGAQREGSHFGRFEVIRDELLELRSRRPAFELARDAARGPVMHVPTAQERVWVESVEAAPLIDAANAAYSAMLRCLGQPYETPARREETRKALLGGALSSMKAASFMGSALTQLRATDENRSPRAEMSFAVPRAIEGALPDVALPALAERLSGIAVRAGDLGTTHPDLRAVAQALREAAEMLRRAT